MAHGHSTRWRVAGVAFLATVSLATMCVTTEVIAENSSDTSSSSSTSSSSTTSTATTSTTSTTGTTSTSTTVEAQSTSSTSPIDGRRVVTQDAGTKDAGTKDESKKDEGKKDEQKKDDSPVPVKAHSWSTTGNSHLASRADDGDPATEFVTQMLDWAPPTWAWLRADLGGNTPLTRIEWMWSAPGAADAFTVEVSAGNGRWITVANPGEAPVGQWTGVTLERETRFVRFGWRNPNGDAQLGHLAEVRFLARPGFEPDGKGMTPQVADVVNTSDGNIADRTKPSTKGDHWVVQRSSRSSNSPDKSSRLPLDGKPTTAWQTALSVAPRTGWTMYDLGDVVSLPAVKWKFSQIGYADRFLVQTSVDGKRWSTIAEQGNADRADSWVTLDTNATTRFVRFFFTNPNGDPNLGFLSEVRFLHP